MDTGKKGWSLGFRGDERTMAEREMRRKIDRKRGERRDGHHRHSTAISLL